MTNESWSWSHIVDDEIIGEDEIIKFMASSIGILTSPRRWVAVGVATNDEWQIIVVAEVRKSIDNPIIIDLFGDIRIVAADYNPSLIESLDQDWCNVTIHELVKRPWYQIFLN